MKFVTIHLSPHIYIMRYWTEESCHLQALVSMVMGTSAEIRRGDAASQKHVV